MERGKGIPKAREEDKRREACECGGRKVRGVGVMKDKELNLEEGVGVMKDKR